MMQRLFRGGRDNNGNASPSSETSSPSPSPSPPPPRAAAVTGPARPIRFVYCDEKGKFRMDPEALATLQLVKEPIGVVSVCGRARQGKSFILNQLTPIGKGHKLRMRAIQFVGKEVRHSLLGAMSDFLQRKLHL